MPEDICPICSEKQYAIMDKIYLKQNGQCWSCDWRDWDIGKLTTEEFELRERLANTTEEKEGK